MNKSTLYNKQPVSHMYEKVNKCVDLICSKILVENSWGENKEKVRNSPSYQNDGLVLCVGNLNLGWLRMAMVMVYL